MKQRFAFLRTLSLFLIVLLIFATYSLRLMQLQLVEGDNYYAQTQKRTQRTVTVPAARGEIVDRNGRPLVVNRSCYNIVFDGATMPKRMQNEIILTLTKIFAEEDAQWISNLPLEQAGASYAFTDATEREIEAVKVNLELQTYATAEHVMTELISRYSLTREDFLAHSPLSAESFLSRYGATREALAARYGIMQEYTPAEQLIIASVRYEMQRKEFSAVTPYTFAEDVDMSIVTKIKENSLMLIGVDVQESTVREYVSADIAPHIIGRIGPIYSEEYAELKEKGYSLNDVVGKEGIEKAFEDKLRGSAGKNIIEYESSGAVANVRELEPPVPGNTVMLTIDAGLQKVAQEALADQIAYLNENHAEGKGKEADTGAVVVLDIASGDILAAATYPSYNINDYQKNYTALSQDPRKPLVNRALTGRYAPGSTFKPMVAAAALSEGIISASSRVTCNHIYTFFNDYQPRCMGAHGSINVITALAVSCNIFFYETGRLTGIDTLATYAGQFGFGQSTGIEIPEAVGQVASPALREKNKQQWYNGDVLQASIGQSDTLATPLQLAQYTATIARKGVRLQSHIVRSIYSYNLDETIYETQPVVAAVMENTNGAFDTVIDGMIACVTSGSARYYLADYPVSIAAKTGTPETLDHLTSVFIAFTPAVDSEIAVAVVIEKGGQGYTGAPVARDIFDAYYAQKKESAKVLDEAVLLM